MDDVMPLLQAAFHEANPYERVTITLGDIDLDVAVARTPEQWARGLIDSDEPNGLLFVMPPNSTYAFHMVGVHRDLAIGLFDPEGNTLDVDLMAAGHGYKSPQTPYRYVLEVPVGNTAGVQALFNRSRLKVPPT